MAKKTASFIAFIDKINVDQLIAQKAGAVLAFGGVGMRVALTLAHPTEMHLFPVLIRHQRRPDSIIP